MGAQSHPPGPPPKTEDERILKSWLREWQRWQRVWWRTETKALRALHDMHEAREQRGERNELHA